MTSAALGLTCILASLLARALPVSLVVITVAFAVTMPHTFAVRFFNRAVRERQLLGSRLTSISSGGWFTVERAKHFGAAMSYPESLHYVIAITIITNGETRTDR